jgi:hypothetical protein
MMKRDKIDFSGMTANERLYHAGKFPEFDKAVAEKDETKLREILRSVEIDEPSIEITIKKVLNQTN